VAVRKLDNMLLVIRDETGLRFDTSVNWRYVESSNVERVGWDNAGNMYVEYQGGSIYVYLGVSRQRAVAAAYAQSVGRYIHRRIKGKFRPLKLETTS
jgi:hypothetical protein